MMRWFRRRRSFIDFPEPVRTAAFTFIGIPSLWPSYLGGTVEQVATRRRRIAARRVAAKSVKNDELRECIGLYLDYYERKLPEIESELVNRTSAKELDAYKRKCALERDAAEQLLIAEGIS